MSQINNTTYSFKEAIELMRGFINGYTFSETVKRFEIKVHAIDQLDWLDAQQASTKIYGSNQEDSTAIAGIGEAVGLSGGGKPDFKKIFIKLRKYLDPQFPFLQWYGGFCFDYKSMDHSWNGFETWRFILPRFELARDGDKMIFCCNLIGNLGIDHMLKELDKIKEPVARKALPLNVIKRSDIPKSSKWHENVDKVLAQIQQGECQKVVLARKTDLTFKETINPWDILKTLKKVTPNSYHFAFQLSGNVFLGASPERLYKRRGRKIISEALAGTKPSTAVSKDLINSSKDRHEHQLVVQAITRDLTPLCKELTGEQEPKIRELTNGIHLHTEFAGTLKDDVNDEDILQALHPTPAVGGTPKEIALISIRRMEAFGRGWYAGPLGYVGLDWAEFVVGIRSGFIKGKKLSVYAGAGIVEGSRAADEWDEVENKISNFIKIVK